MLLNAKMVGPSLSPALSQSVGKFSRLEEHGKKANRQAQCTFTASLLTRLCEWEHDRIESQTTFALRLEATAILPQSESSRLIAFVPFLRFNARGHGESGGGREHPSI
jgi:hypothetical protein